MPRFGWPVRLAFARITLVGVTVIALAWGIIVPLAPARPETAHRRPGPGCPGGPRDRLGHVDPLSRGTEPRRTQARSHCQDYSRSQIRRSAREGDHAGVALAPDNAIRGGDGQSRYIGRMTEQAAKQRFLALHHGSGPLLPPKPGSLVGHTAHRARLLGHRDDQLGVRGD